MRVNRIKRVLAETKQKEWLAEELNKGKSAISAWCTNTRWSSLESLQNITRILNLDIREQLNPIKALNERL